MCRFELVGVIILIIHDIKDALQRKKAQPLDSRALPDEALFAR